MKKQLLIIVMLLPLTIAANDKKYENAMNKAIEQLFKGQSAEDYQESAATFERIGQAEEGKWLPAYYASLSYLWMMNHISVKDKKDEVLDEAQKQLDVAAERSENNAEIITLQGYIHMMRVTVDPASRGAEYSPKSMQAFNKALSIEPDNPRAMLLLGQMQHGTAQFFGNDTKEPCATIKKAVALLDDEKHKSKIEPSWGKRMASYAIKNCD